MTDFAGQNRYAPPRAEVDDHPAQAEDLLIPAGRGARLAAAIIDSLWVVGALALVAIPAYTTYRARVAGAPVASAGGGFVSLVVTVGILVYLVCNMVLVHRYGQTVGKRAMGIRVARTDGSRVSMARFILIRNLPVYVLGAIPLVGKLTGIVDALLIFRESRQCLHDTIADTMVVTADSSGRATLDGERHTPVLRTFTL